MTCKNQLNAVVVFLALILSLNTTAQKNNSTKYQDSISLVLKANPNVKDFFFDKEFYKNKQLKHQKLYVKFNSDSIDRYIHVGKCFHYRRNGLLEGYHQTNMNTLKDEGRSLFYNRKGKLDFIMENINIDAKEKIDTLKFTNLKIGHAKYYWMQDSGLMCFERPYKLKNIIISKCTPKFYIVVTYHDGCKSDYTEYWYDPAKKEYIKLKKEKYLIVPKE